MKWNNDEINFLINNSNTKTLYELANESQTTTTSVYKKLAKLGFSYKKNCVNTNYTNWNEDDILFLQKTILN